MVSDDGGFDCFLQEQRRLAKEHPNEPDIVVCKSPNACYVKGRLQPTRALGDVYLKDAEFNGSPSARRYGRYIAPPYSPPYITSEPEVRLTARSIVALSWFTAVITIGDAHQSR